MPRVPTVNSPGVENRPIDFVPQAPQRIENISADAFGAARGRALGQLGGAVQDVGDNFEHVARVVAEEDALRQTNIEAIALDDQFADILYGQDGFLTRQGEAANAEAGAATRVALEKAIRSRASNIKNREVQNRFQSYAAGQLRAAIDPMARHSAVEAKRASAQIAEVRQGQAVREAVAGRSDPEAITGAMQKGFAAIDIAAVANGLPAEVQDQQERAFASTLHISVIESFGQSYDVEGATAYYNKVKGAIDPTLRDDVQQTINSFASARSAEEARQRAALEDRRKEEKLQIGNKFFSALATNQLTAADVMQSDLPALGPGGKREWLKLIQEGAAGQAQTNPAVFNELFRRIQLPEGAASRLTDADELNQYMGSGLTFADINQLRNEVEGANTPEGKQRSELRNSLFKTARNQISGTNEFTGIRDPRGEELYQRWLSETLAEEDSQRKDGKLGVESYNPNSQIFLGRNIAQYRRSTADMLKDMATSLGGTTSESDLAARATRTGALNGRKAFEVDGVWLYGDGTKVEQ